LKKEAINIIKTLRENDFESYLAGGCVRDILLNRKPKDYDIATNAKPNDIEKIFDKTISVGKKFGVIIVIMNEKQFEIATFRKDGQYKDGRRPSKIEFSSIEEDAQRRDFTINALFLDPIDNKIYDFVNGKKDLENKIIRFVGKPEERIQEDRLRIMRGIRFALKYNFTIEKETYKAIKRNSYKINDISQERITEELFKMLDCKQPREMLNLLFDTNLIYYILPEIAIMKNITEPIKYHPEKYLLEHTIRTMENLNNEKDLELIFAGMIHDIGKPHTRERTNRIRYNGHDKVGADMTERLCERLKLSNAIKIKLVALVGNHMKFQYIKEMKKSKLKKYISSKYWNELLKLHKADCLASNMNLENYNYAIKKQKILEKEGLKPDPFIAGKDLINMGFIPSPQFSKILNEVYILQLENELKNKEECIKYIKDREGNEL